MARSEQKAARQAEARAQYQAVLRSPPELRDEYGIPLALYAAAALVGSGADRGEIVALLGRLGPAVLAMIRNLAGKAGAADGRRRFIMTVELETPGGGQVRFGGGKPFVLIAGPCVIESEEHVHFLAREIGRMAGPFVLKASFDKANRSSLAAYRGPGLNEGLRILAGVKAQGYPILTDIHEPAQAGPAAQVADILQIPAFLCRQTDVLLEAGRNGRNVNIKKAQFVAP